MLSGPRFAGSNPKVTHVLAQALTCASPQLLGRTLILERQCAFSAVHGLVSWWLGSKESACNAGDGFYPWVGKVSWRRKSQPAPVFLSGESQGQRSLACCRLWGHKELDMTKATELN